MQGYKARKERQSDSSEATTFRFSTGGHSMQESRESVQLFKSACSDQFQQEQPCSESVRVFAGVKSALSSRPSHRYADEDESEPTPTTPRDLFRPGARTTRY